MNIQQAHEVAIRQLKSEHAARAVTVEFTSMAGITKYLRVWRSDQIEVMNTIEEVESA